MNTVPIAHYSDVLCVWAYIGQVRVKTLQENFPDQVSFDFHYFSVFGDIPLKMAEQWAERGGAPAYADHVHEVAAGFEHITLHDDVWRENIPLSSMPAHLFLSAAKLLEQDHPDYAGVQQGLDTLLRSAFFEAALDISNNDVLTQLVDEAQLPVDLILGYLRDGKAHAALATDVRTAGDKGVKSSPTMLLNEGRQMLAGNVGYRVLEANISELLVDPGDQQSWC